MATFNSANNSYQSGNKTLFETQMLAISNGHIVDATHRLPVDIGNTTINISGNVNISTPNTVTVNSSPSDPVHVHLTEVGNTNITGLNYVPIGGIVSVNNVVTVSNAYVTTQNVSFSNQTIYINGGTSNTNIYNSNGSSITNTTPLPVIGLSGNNISSAPFEWQVAMGHIPEASQVNIFGYSANVTNAFSVVWENSSVDYQYLTAAHQLSINSTSTSDSSTAQVTLYGLDTDWSPLVETANLNGTSVVTTTNSFLRVNSMVLTKPANGQEKNIGRITAYYNSTPVAIIDPSIGRTQMTQYSVANGHTLYVQNINMFSGDSAGASKDMNFRVDVKNNVSNVNFILLHTTWQNSYQLTRTNPFAYSSKSDIRWQMATNSGTYSGSAVVEGILISN